MSEMIMLTTMLVAFCALIVAIIGCVALNPRN